MELKSGDLVELSVDANVIPPGRYYYIEHLDDVIVLQVANDIVIGLCLRYWQPFLKKVSDEKARPTSKKKFLDLYFTNIEEGRHLDAPTSIDRMTFCFMEPRDQRAIGARRMRKVWGINAKEKVKNLIIAAR